MQFFKKLWVCFYFVQMFFVILIAWDDFLDSPSGQMSFICMMHISKILMLINSSVMVFFWFFFLSSFTFAKFSISIFINIYKIVCCFCNSFTILQARILALNASYFLKNGGHFVISIKVYMIWTFIYIFCCFIYWMYVNWL